MITSDIEALEVFYARTISPYALTSMISSTIAAQMGKLLSIISGRSTQRSMPRPIL
jgi:ABC-type transport system involved in cytochrome bd biosynthesis fused ATPase/permease subunit